MLENIPQSNFSKQVDRNKFDKLPQEGKNLIIGTAQEDAAVEEIKKYLKQDQRIKAYEVAREYSVASKKIISPEIQDLLIESVIRDLEKNKKKRELPGGIQELTVAAIEDVLNIEKIAFADNQALIGTDLEDPRSVRMKIISKDIYNIREGSPNMSFIYKDTLDNIQGFILAYEINSVDMDNKDIYVASLAVLPNAKMAGGRLLNIFLQECKRQYLDKGINIKIRALARNETSYGILKKQLDRMGEKIGVELKIIEGEIRIKGGEKIHEIVIQVK